MYNVITTGLPEIRPLITSLADIPGVSVEYNFQQIIGMVKERSLRRLCIWQDVWNLDGGIKGQNNYRGQTGAEKVHEIDPDIPILIWDGRVYRQDDDFPVVLTIYGDPIPIKNKNELYLEALPHQQKSNYTARDIYYNTKKFFEGTLTLDDVPVRECLGMMWD